MSSFDTHTKVCDWNTGIQSDQQLRSRTFAMIQPRKTSIFKNSSSSSHLRASSYRCRTGNACCYETDRSLPRNSRELQLLFLYVHTNQGAFSCSDSMPLASAYATLDSSCNPSFHISVTANWALIVITAIGHSPEDP
ncbi:hypothetical protein AFLA_012408 [Aspergillus flavus NRRL3357]|nr:hypothetical protein AFLA_012408 [Aspergillus flavus NRRL3357]